MFTKVIKGCPDDVMTKRIARIQEALNIKYLNPQNPTKYIVDKLPDGTEVFFLKPGKEFFRKIPNINDMLPNVGKMFQRYSFSDIWGILCKLYNTISIDNFKKLSVILYREAYLLDFNFINGKVRFAPDKTLTSEINTIQKEVDEKGLNLNVLAFIHFIDLLSWNEDVKYHVIDNKPDFSETNKRKNGRINNILSCISIPLLFQEFVDEVLKNKDNKENIDFSIIINVAQKFAKTRGIHPQTNKELIKLLNPYLTI